MAIRNLIHVNIKLTDLWLTIEFQMTHNAIKFKANFLPVCDFSWHCLHFIIHFNQHFSQTGCQKVWRWCQWKLLKNRINLPLVADLELFVNDTFHSDIIVSANKKIQLDFYTGCLRVNWYNNLALSSRSTNNFMNHDA